MRILLDTHVFLWFCMGDVRLSDTARKMIENKSNQRLLSIISVWEMTIKIGLGKLRIHQPIQTLLPDQMKVNRIDLLELELDHIYRLIQMPLYHRDPFDRLLISQSISEQIPIVSADLVFDAYSIERLW